MSDVPLNVQEFNQVAGLIFAQLYRAFPGAVDINRAGIAEAMGVVGSDWGNHKLPSGQSFNDMLDYSIFWLRSEGYTRVAGLRDMRFVSLTEKGLAAMNAVPSWLKGSVGNELTKATEQGPASKLDLSAIGDLVGSVIGGFTKSVAGP
jgi:hypothetical protein